MYFGMIPLLYAITAVATITLSCRLSPVTTGHTSKKSCSYLIACVGNSITSGRGLADPAKNAFPAQLQSMLGDGFDIRNLGISGRFVTRNFTIGGAYWNEPQFKELFVIRPDIILMMLGTNDSKEVLWTGARHFKEDYDAMIDTFTTIENKPVIIILSSIPALDSCCCEIRPAYVDSIAVIQKQVATTHGLLFIDTYSPFVNHSELYQDGVHPTQEGARLIARTVNDSITSWITDGTLACPSAQ